MIALVRKNVACLISKHNSFVCKSIVPFSLSLHLFSTLTERQLDTSTRVYDVLVHKHHFSPQVASLAASDFTRFRKPENADSILLFLKESGFSTTQLEKIVKSRPRILTASLEDDIKCKIKILQDLGLSSVEIAKIISTQSSILHMSLKNNIIPSVSLLKGLLGSNHDVARLLRRSAWFISADLERTLMPNVEFLKSCGIPMGRILLLLYTYPRCLLIKPDILRKCVDKAKEMGFNQSSKMFIYAVRIVTSLSKETWELKLQALRNLGFSDSDIMTMFRKAPVVFSLSIEKIQKVKELLLATGKFNISSIVNNPSSLGSSIEKRYKPRLRMLGILESRNLIKKWPNLGTVYTLTDAKFFEKFIGPYSDELGEAFVTNSYVKGKKR